MPEIVKCPECGRQLRVPETLLGKNVKCPACSTTFTAGGTAGPGPEEDADEARERVTSRRSRPAPGPEDEDEPPEEDYEEEPRGRRRFAGRARDAVNGPAIGLLVSGIVGVFFSSCSVLMNLLQTVGGVAVMAAPNMGPQARDAGMQNMVSGPVGLVSAVLGLAAAVVVILGAQRMRRLESYSWAMASAVLTVIPCTTCCLWGLPLGIWALVVLNRPEVKSAFRA